MLEIEGTEATDREVGGQAIRVAIALSAILKQPIRINNIRKNRPKPGLADQHIKGIELVRDICGAHVNGLEIGSTSVEFIPNDIKVGTFEASCEGAGSIALLFQVALPVILFAKQKLNLTLRGGTNVSSAPFVDYTSKVFLPNLEKFGASFDVVLEERGYAPFGGGHCFFDADPIKYLKAVNITERGDIEGVRGSAFVSGTIPQYKSNKMRQGAIDELTASLELTNIKIDAYKETPDAAKHNGEGILVYLKTKGKCRLGASSLCCVPNVEEDIGKTTVRELLRYLNSEICVDDHLQDQLIIYMALAKGKSSIRVGVPLTMHTHAAINVCKNMTNATFNIIYEGLYAIIECNGIGFQNKFLTDD